MRIGSLCVVVLAGLLVATPASANSWRESVTAGVGDWLSWGKAQVSAVVPNEAPNVSALVDQATTFVKSYGPNFPTLEPGASRSEGWSETVQQSVGCVVGGTAGTATALLAGGENLVNIIAGGVVTAANPLVLYVGLFGVVFASFCAVGQAMTPLYIHYTQDPAPVLPPLSAPPPDVRTPLAPEARVYFIAAPGARP